jgi:hypothetical protein
MRFKGSLAKGLIAALVLTLVPLVAFSAQKITPGSTCKVLNQKVVYQNKSYSCTKSGKKLVWNKGVAVKKSTPTLTPTPTLTLTPTPSPTLSISRANAVRSAERYLRSDGFSRSRLIAQLLFEGYSQDDAEFAVTSVGL